LGQPVGDALNMSVRTHCGHEACPLPVATGHMAVGASTRSRRHNKRAGKSSCWRCCSWRCPIRRRPHVARPGGGTCFQPGVVGLSAATSAASVLMWAPAVAPPPPKAAPAFAPPVPNWPWAIPNLVDLTQLPNDDED
jgi:hypothetical protein